MTPVLFTSVPKCGTHLMLNYFRATGFEHAGPFGATLWDDRFVDIVRDLRPGQYSAWHFEWRPDVSAIAAERGIRVVFLYRDPRAHLVSQLHFILKTPAHPWHRYLNDRFQTNDERLVRLIEGVPPEDKQRYFADYPVLEPHSSAGVRPRFAFGMNFAYGAYAGWLKDPRCLPVKFEDAVGPRGGGDRERQLGVVRRLLDFTEVDRSTVHPRAVAGALFDEGATTFRQGSIDSWRKDFSEPVEAAFMRESAKLLEVFGYEA